MVQRKLSRIAMITITFASLALMLTAYAAINVSTSINSSGTIVVPVPSNIGVFSDSACTTPLAPLDWGSLTPGGTVTKTFYVKNTAGAANLKIGRAHV